MNVGATSGLGSYNYQTALTAYGQGPASTPGSAQNTAVLQALTNTYTSLATNSNGLLPAPDALSALAGSDSALASLVSGMYSASVANGSSAFPLPALSGSLATVGGLDAASASTLFSGKGNSGLGGLSSSAINLNASLALASYANYQSGITTGTIGAAATAAASKLDATQPANIQNAIQNALSGTLSNLLNLVG